MKYIHELKIPKERIAVLVGTKGKIKRKIEEETKTKMNVDSNEGNVTISGEDGLGLYTAKEVTLAIGRGFNPEYAFLLLKGDYMFELLNIEEHAPVKSKNDFKRLKGRVIGKEGRSRRLIEEYTHCYMSVYGKTIGLIGKPEDIEDARKAVLDLLRGAPHGNVYKWLEKNKKEKRKESMLSE
ncbi:RNA-processing protein [Candidatus Woesearchaeota archaeon]|nr:RNA-processing protein [Candidatus Woesearchaeota archaeon]